MTDAHPDVRLEALKAWLAAVLPVPMAAIAPASSDASFRRYFRVTLVEAIAVPERTLRASTLIAMDARNVRSGTAMASTSVTRK